MSFHEIWSIIIPSVIGVVGVFSGIWIGQHLSDRKEMRQKTEELEKIRYLINADFTLIKRQTDNGITKEKETLEQLVNQNGIAYYASSLEIFSDHLHKFGFSVGGFTYWDSLTSSGNLIKIEPDELRIITTTHRLVTKIISQQQESFDRFMKDILYSMFENPTTIQQRIEIFKSKYQLYYKLAMKGYEILQKHMFNAKENISWINLNTEPILEFKHQQDNVKIDTPIVTEEGITIYPDGTRVDRKGTIL